MSSTSEVGVVIPTYNRAALLRETLISVMSQTVMPVEVVVVDDGSTDDTQVVASEFTGLGARVVCLALPHSGRQGPLRNAGVEATTTPIVAFLDSDDLWKPHRIETQLDVWERNPGAGFAFCNAQRFDKAGPVGTPWLPTTPRWNGYILGDVLEEPLTGGSTLMVRREAFERVGPYKDIRTAEDYEWLLRMAARYPASYAPEPLVLIREHEGRTTRTLEEKPMLDYISVVEGFMAANPQLPGTTRARARRGLANVHYKLARFYIELGRAREARKHLRAMSRLKPLDRRLFPAWLEAMHPPLNNRDRPRSGVLPKVKQRGDE